MKYLICLVIAVGVAFMGCGSEDSPTATEPTISARSGTWTGTTAQNLGISLVVVESPDSVGYVQTEVNVAATGDPIIFTWTLSKNVAYGATSGEWNMNASVTDQYNNVHSISIDAEFTADDECSGTLDFSSPTYNGGYDFKNVGFDVYY